MLNGKSKRTILLVEDEAVTALAASKTLENSGYAVISVYTGEDAVETVETTRGIDLILMDIDLGRGIDGTTAAKQILGEFDIPLVFLSAHTEPEVVQKTEGITCYGYIVKNSGATVLNASINMAFKLFEEKQRVRDHQQELVATNEELEATNEELLATNEQLEESQREILKHGKALQQSEELLRKIAENYPNSFISIIEKDYTIGFTSGQEFKKQNLDPQEYIGTTLEEAFGDNTPLIRGYYEKTFKGEEQSFELYIYNQYQLYRTVPLFAGNGSVNRIISVAENITDRKEAENKIKEALEEATLRQREIAALLEASQAIPLCRTFEEAARKIFDICRELIGAKSGYVALLSEDRSENEVLFLDAGGLPCTVDPELPMPIRGLREVAYRTGKAAYDNNYVDSKWVKFMPPGHVKLDNVLFAPLLIDDRPVGLIGLGNKPGGFSERDAKIARGFGDLAAVALTYGEYQDQLLESEERFRMAQEATSDGLWDWNLKTGAVYWSPRSYTMLGYEPDEFPVTWEMWRSLINTDDLLRCEPEVQKSLQSGETFAIEFRYKRKDGAWQWILGRGRISERDEEGNPLRMVGTHVDISERKLAEAEGERTRVFMQTVIDGFPEVLMVVNLDFTIALANRTVREMTGGRDPVSSRMLCHLVSHHNELPCRGMEHPCPMREVVERKSSVAVEHVHLNAAGEKTYVEIVAAPIFDEGGEVVQVIESARDITVRKRTENMQAAQLRLIEYSMNYSIWELLQKFLDEAEELTDSEIGFYHFFEENHQYVSLQAWSTNTLEKMCSAEGTGMHYSISGAGVWMDCVREGRPVIHNDYAGLSHKKGLPEGHTPVIRELVVPVFRGENIVAVLGVGNKKNDYNENDVETIQKLADMAWETVVHKRVEDALQREKEFTDTALDAQKDTFFLLDPATGKALRWNRSFREISGYTDEEIARMPAPNSYYSPEDLERAGVFIQKVLEEGVGTIELELICKDGRRVPTEYRVSVIKDERGEPEFIISIGRDITERKRIEKELHSTQMHYKDFINASSDSVTYWKMPEGLKINLPVEEQIEMLYCSACVDANRAAWETFGFHSKIELIGKKYFELIQGRTFDAFFSKFIHNNYNLYNHQIFEKFKSGEMYYGLESWHGVIEDGILINLWSVSKDITAQKSAELALKESEEHFRNLFENMSSGVVVYEAIDDGDDFILADLNAAGQRMSQAKYEEIIGRRATEFFPAVKKMGLFECLRLAHRTGEPQSLPLTKYQDGRIQKWVESHVYRLPSGKIVALYEDRTEQQKLEERLRQSEKMEAIGHLAGGIAHDFNNMLAGIFGYASMSLDQVPEESILARNLRMILKAGERAKHLVQQILTFSRQDREQKNSSTLSL